MSELVLGLDAGTSSLKAIAIEPDGRLVGAAARRTPRRAHGSIGPDELVAAALATLEEALPEDARALAIGVAGIAESGLRLDGRGRPAGTIAAWHDASGDALARALAEEVGELELLRRTGQLAARRLSLVRHRALVEAAGTGRSAGPWVGVPEWIVLRLGGVLAYERSLASRMGFLDLETARWDPELAAWGRLPIERMPDPEPAGTPIARVRASDVPARLRGALLALGGHDHLTAAHGVGAVGPGDVFDSWGNGEALLRAAPDPLPSPKVLAAHGATVSWHVCGGGRVLMRGLGTGLILHAVLRRLGVEDPFRTALDAGAAVTPAAQGVTLPAPGETEPLELPDGADPAALWRAALDEVFSRVAAGVAALDELAGPHARVVGAGGWLRSAPLRALKEQAVHGFGACGIDEPGALGAALLAREAICDGGRKAAAVADPPATATIEGGEQP